MNEHRFPDGVVRLSDYFNRPIIIEQNDNMDDLTRGMSYQPQKASDQYFDPEVYKARLKQLRIQKYRSKSLFQITHFLFRNGRPLGADLHATDIQRNRDHGIASYNNYREYCGLPRAQSFQDFTDYISSSVRGKIFQEKNKKINVSF